MTNGVYEQKKLRPAGYTALIDCFNLEVIPNWHRSFVAYSGVHRMNKVGGAIEEIFPKKYWPGDGPGEQLEFALKYDGISLAILDALFRVLNPDNILKHVKSKPTGKYSRRLWFLYEFLTGTRLEIEDLKRGNYIDLLDSGRYYTSSPRQIRRQRINENLLGNSHFCPMVRRTDDLNKFESSDLAGRCMQKVSAYPPGLLRRAMSYLYTRETKSSFEIEHIKPNTARTERFVSLLRLAEREDFCIRARLIDLQNRIVDPRFRDPDYRKSQNYVSETTSWQKEAIYFVGPKPVDLDLLMQGLIDAHRRMDTSGVNCVIHAAVVAYGFVFLHPFTDGNGRIHRFLVHNILARRNFTPKGIMFPVSASILKDIGMYHTSLEAFSQALMPWVDYSLDGEGLMVVKNDTASFYRYIDMTPQAEALFHFTEQTIDNELVRELTFLESYDKAKKAIQDIADIPDKHINLFIRACLQNQGRISKRKKASHFDLLSNMEIGKMEEAVRACFKIPVDDSRVL